MLANSPEYFAYSLGEKIVRNNSRKERKQHK